MLLKWESNPEPSGSEGDPLDGVSQNPTFIARVTSGGGDGGLKGKINQQKGDLSVWFCCYLQDPTWLAKTEIS